MTQKHELPGVDPEPLGPLAGQFPSAAAPEAGHEAEPARPQTVIIRKRNWFALLIALAALLVAGASLVMPTLKPWLKANYRDHPAVALLIGPKTEIEALRENVETLRRQFASLGLRADAGETNVADAAGRLGRLEKTTETLAARLEALTAVPQTPPVAAMPAPSGEFEAWGAMVLKRVESLELGSRDAAGRHAALETQMTALARRLESVDAAGADVRPLAERLASVEASLAAEKGLLAEAAAAAKAATAAAGASTLGQEKLNTALATLENRLEEIRGTAGAAETRLAALEGAISQNSGLIRSVRLAVAILQLNAVAETHKPYARETEQVRRLAAEQPGVLSELDRMTASADTGVATVAELRDSFSAILVPRLRALAEGGDRPWVDRVREWASNAISPSAPLPSEKRDPTLKLVDGTVQRLAEDDLEGAVAVLSQMEGPPATLAQRWLVEARARLVVDRAAETLAGLALELFGRK